MERTIVGIDLGTTKVCTLVAQIEDESQLRIIGVGVSPSRGIAKGVITDLDAATRSIGDSVERAERVSGQTVTQAYVSVSGNHISSSNSRGVAAIGRGDRPVDRDDVDRALEAAQAIAVPHNRRIIHSIPRSYVLDGQDGIKNPLGLLGYRLEVECHLVTGAVASIQNVIHCVERNQLQVADLVLAPLASAEAVLTDEEKEMGVALVDVGGGTIDMAIFVEGSVWETGVVALGGNHITNDIAIGLRTPFATAEDVKVRYARALPSSIPESEVIEITTFGNQGLTTISRRQLCDIVQWRASEMLDLVAQGIRRSGFDGLLPAGVVLTGGTANLRGLTKMASTKLGLPVRLGTPRRLLGLVEAISSPVYASAVGLLLWAARQETAAPRGGDEGGGRGWAQQLGDWLRIFLPRG